MKKKTTKSSFASIDAWATKKAGFAKMGNQHTYWYVMSFDRASWLKIADYGTSSGLNRHFSKATIQKLYKGQLKSNLITPGAKIIKGYKAFDLKPNGVLSCRNYLFKEGGTYTETGTIKLCTNGFHFCEKIEDVLSHYNFLTHPSTMAVAIIEGSGNRDVSDNKIAVETIHIKKVLNFSEIFKAFGAKKIYRDKKVRVFLYEKNDGFRIDSLAYLDSRESIGLGNHVLNNNNLFNAKRTKVIKEAADDGAQFETKVDIYEYSYNGSTSHRFSVLKAPLKNIRQSKSYDNLIIK